MNERSCSNSGDPLTLKSVDMSNESDNPSHDPTFIALKLERD